MMIVPVCTLEHPCSPLSTDRLHLLCYVTTSGRPSICLSSPSFRRRDIRSVIAPSMVSKPHHMQPVRVSRVSDGSETESDDEPLVPVMSVTGSNPYSQSEPLEARPTFRLGLNQKHLGPLVLDQRKHVRVPSTINTFLRDYQRDGVKFLYEKFRNSVGGMLGDDMGLVGVIWNSG